MVRSAATVSPSPHKFPGSATPHAGQIGERDKHGKRPSIEDAYCTAAVQIRRPAGDVLVLFSLRPSCSAEDAGSLRR